MEFYERIPLDLLGYRPVQAVLIVASAFVAARLVDRILASILLRWARRTRTLLDDEVIALLHGPLIKTVVLIGLAIAAHRLALPQGVADFTARALQTIALFVWMAFAFRLSGVLIGSASRQEGRFRTIDERTFPLFSNLAKVVIVAAAVYLLIVAWDVDATGWIASAGIVGLAVSFAAQDTLANLFAGVFIIADAPYRVGDYILLEGGDRGKVINIGLRSTRILTRDDIELTIPNSVMGKARIRNETAGPSPRRRVRVPVGVAYGSDLERVRAVLLEVAAGVEAICDDPEPRVRFRAFGDSGVSVELLAWVPEPVMRGRAVDELITGIYARFREAGIEIPYPKRDLYIREMPGRASDAPAGDPPSGG
jgi:small-conductance mechanosensitive channel